MRVIVQTLFLSVCILFAGCSASFQSKERSSELLGNIRHINPEGLNKNPAFTNVITVGGTIKTIYIGGQDAVDSTRQIIGKGDIGKQAEQVMKNIQIALQAAGAKPEHVVKFNVHIVQGQSLQAAVQGFQKVWTYRANPPTITVAFVSGLAHPDFLIEVDAIAVMPQ